MKLLLWYKTIYLTCVPMLDCACDAFFDSYSYKDIYLIFTREISIINQIAQMMFDFVFSSNFVKKYFPPLLSALCNFVDIDSLLCKSIYFIEQFSHPIYMRNPHDIFVHIENNDWPRLLSDLINKLDLICIHETMPFYVIRFILSFKQNQNINRKIAIQMCKSKYVNNLFRPLELIDLLYSSLNESSKTILNIVKNFVTSIQNFPEEIPQLINFHHIKEVFMYLFNVYNGFNFIFPFYTVCLIQSLYKPEDINPSILNLRKTNQSVFIHFIASVIFFELRILSKRNQTYFYAFNEKCREFLCKSPDLIQQIQKEFIQEYPGNNFSPKELKDFNVFNFFLQYSKFSSFCNEIVTIYKKPINIPEMTNEIQPEYLHCKEYIYLEEFQDACIDYANNITDTYQNSNEIDPFQRLNFIIPIIQYLYDHANDRSMGPVFSEKFPKEKLDYINNIYNDLILKQFQPHPVPQPKRSIMYEISYVNGPLLTNSIIKNKISYRFIYKPITELNDNSNYKNILAITENYDSSDNFYGKAINFIFKCNGYLHTLETLLEEIDIFEKRQLLNKKCFDEELEFLYILRSIFCYIKTAKSSLEFHIPCHTSKYDLFESVVTFILHNGSISFIDIIHDEFQKTDNDQHKSLVFLRKAIIFLFICLDNSAQDISHIDWENVLRIENIESLFKVSVPENLKVIEKYRFPSDIPHDYCEFINPPYNFNNKDDINKFICLLDGEIKTHLPIDETKKYQGMLIPFLCYQGDQATCLFVANDNDFQQLNTPYANIYGIRDIGIKFKFVPQLDEQMLDREIDNFLKTREISK